MSVSKELFVRKPIIMKIFLAIASFIGVSKSLANNSAKSNFDDCSGCKDISIDQDISTEIFDKTYIYTNKTLVDGAVSFLKEQNIPYGIKYFENETTTISIKNKHEIILSTQRWGAMSIRE